MHSRDDFHGKACKKTFKYHISNCITCSKNLHNISCHPQLHLEIPNIPFACIAIDTIGKLPTTSSGNRYALTCIDVLTTYIIAVPMPDKTAESVVEVYLSGVLSRTRASMVCLLDNGLELKKHPSEYSFKAVRHKMHIFHPLLTPR